MTTTHIHLMQTLDRRPVKADGIHIGLKVTYPCATGGVLPYKCTSINNHYAVFASCDSDWPGTVTVEFNQDDFTPTDLNELINAMKRFETQNAMVSKEERALIKRAHQFGYIHQISYTQAQWTTKGIKASEALTH